MTMQGTLITEPKEFEVPKAAPETQAITLATPMQMLAFALQNADRIQGSVEIVRSMREMCNEDRRLDAKQAFAAAMEAAQNEISAVAPDATRTDTGSSHATFKALNKALRPVYLRHGFTLSFGTEQSAKEHEVIIVCDCSHKGGHEKRYQIPMPNDGKGAKDGGVMSKPDATVAATTRGRNTLLRLIFNLSIEEPELPGMENLEEHLHFIRDANTKEAMQQAHEKAVKAADEAKDSKAVYKLNLAFSVWLIEHAPSLNAMKATYFAEFKAFEASKKENRMAQDALVAAKDKWLKENQQ